jgi:hypothetical protein
VKVEGRARVIDRDDCFFRLVQVSIQKTLGFLVGDYLLNGHLAAKHELTIGKRHDVGDISRRNPALSEAIARRVVDRLKLGIYVRLPQPVLPVASPKARHGGAPHEVKPEVVENKTREVRA